MSKTERTRRALWMGEVMLVCALLGYEFAALLASAALERSAP